MKDKISTPVDKICKYQGCKKPFIDDTFNHRMIFCCRSCQQKNRYHTVERIQNRIMTVKEYAIHRARVNNGYEQPRRSLLN